MNFNDFFKNRQPNVAVLGVVLVLLAGWLVFEPYHGFFHDGILYSMLGLYNLYPANYQNDLFVAYGSQGEFSIFPAVFAELIKLLGLDGAALFYTAVGQIVWLTGLYFLVRRLTLGWERIAAFACIVFFTRYYDSTGQFSYAEPFPTPRILAEGLTLLALSFIPIKRYICGAVFWAVGASFHPLMGIYVFCLGLLVFFFDTNIAKRTRLFVFLLLGGIGVSAAIFRVSVFARFLHPFGKEWYAILLSGGMEVLPENWEFGTVLRVGYFLSILCVAWWRGLPGICGLVRGVFLALAIFMGVWLIGTGALHDQLITQLQPWRCLWVVQILALIAQGALLVRLWPVAGPDRWLASFMTIALLQQGFSVSGGGYALVMVWCGVLVYFLTKCVPVQLRNKRLLSLLPFVLPVPQLLSNLAKAWLIRGPLVDSMTVNDWHWVLGWVCAGCLFSLLIVFVLCRIRACNFSKAHVGLLALGVVCLVSGFGIWSPSFKLGGTPGSVEYLATIKKIQQEIPEKAVVYSDLGLQWTWFVLGRSDYLDIRQMSGIVFSEDTALESMRRLNRLCALGVSGCPSRGGIYVNPADSMRNDAWRENIGELCKDPLLNYLVLFGKVDGTKLFEDGRGGYLSVFKCN